MKCKIQWIIVLLHHVLCVCAGDLQIGDSVPNLQFKNIVNYPKSNLSLEEIGDKIVIIDFWGRGCGTCISEMPLVAELQKKYANEVFFILATSDLAPKVEAFYKRRNDLKALHLPVSADTSNSLSRYFPYKSIPQLVWIGKDRKVKAITAGQDLTEANLLHLIVNNTLSLPVKKDLCDYNYNATFKENGLTIDRKPFFESHLLGYQSGIVSEYGNSTTVNRTRLFATNSGLPALYAFAYRFQEYWTPVEMQNRIIFARREDSLLFFPMTVQDPFQRGRDLWCYELMLSPMKGHEGEIQSFRYMQKDLDHYFNLNSRMVRMMRDCYVVTASVQSSHTKNDSVDFQEAISYSTLINWSLQDIVNYISSVYAMPLPLVCDDTTSRVTIKLKNNYSEWKDLQRDMFAAGLRISEVRREINVLKINPINDANSDLVRYCDTIHMR